MKETSMHICAVGDSFIIDRPSHADARMGALRELISAGDVSLTNVESTLHEFEADIYPSRESGGDWSVADPAVLEELKWLGLKLLSAPNNHSLDFLHNGVMRTIRAFRDAGMPFAGIGGNLAEAEAPCYLSTPKGRVALIALNLSFEKWHPAGEQRRDFGGRPGINYVEHRKIYGLDEAAFAALEALVERYPSLGTREGDALRMGDSFFERGEKKIRTEAARGDVERLKRSISRARRQADYVLVSAHSHENRDGDAHRPAEFEEALAHACIDAGADAYIGHGAHLVRGIEIYKDRPILYSLGNFFYQCELIERSPEAFYHKFADFDATACTADVFDYREKNGGILGETNPEYYRSMLVDFALDADGKLGEMIIHPLDLNFEAHRSRKGTPELAGELLADRLFQELEARSETYGTHFVREGNILRIKR